MSVDTTEDRLGGAVAEVKEKGEGLVSATQEQVSAKAQELGMEASFQIREQLDQRSTVAGEQVRSVGKALRSGADQLRNEGNDMPAKVVEQVARLADELGGYLQSSQADRMLEDFESFARRRPWLTAGAGVLAGFLGSRFVKASTERRYTGAQGNGHRSSVPTQRSLTAGGV